MLKYWLWLATRKGLGSRGLAALLDRFSSPEEIYFAGREDYEQLTVLHSLESLMDKSLECAEQICNACFEKGIGILTMQDAAYPSRLRSTDDPPAVLYYRGTLPDFSGPIVGVVGTRKASVYGLVQAKRLGYGLARNGCAVVSGMAKGVDAEAMVGALMGGGAPVIGVLGCGVDVVYPAENRALYRDVQSRGCLISEYPPGTEPWKGHFPQRNRIISGLSLGIVVAEAPAKSGALITAERALEQGRDVFTFPANVDAESCQGNLRLLREGAILIRDYRDVLQEYLAMFGGKLTVEAAPLPVQRPPQPPQILPVEDLTEAPKEKIVVDKPENRHYIDLKEHWESLSADERALAQLLQQGPKHMDDLTEGTKLSATRILASLTLLEVKGIVRRPSAKWYELTEAE